MKAFKTYRLATWPYHMRLNIELQAKKKWQLSKKANFNPNSPSGAKSLSKTFKTMKMLIQTNKWKSNLWTLLKNFGSHIKNGDTQLHCHRVPTYTSSIMVLNQSGKIQTLKKDTNSRLKPRSNRLLNFGKTYFKPCWVNNLKSKVK